jgi:hypothetical protein
MIREEFSRLIYMYQEAAEGKGGDMQELFQKSLDFIELLKQMLIQGDQEDKAAAMRMMEELQKHMKDQLKIMSKKSGITEEQLMANAEDPANFTKEQWQKMQETKERLAREGKELVKILHEEKSDETKPQSPESLVKQESVKKKAPKVKKAKKSDWMRS